MMESNDEEPLITYARHKLGTNKTSSHLIEGAVVAPAQSSISKEPHCQPELVKSIRHRESGSTGDKKNDTLTSTIVTKQILGNYDSVSSSGEDPQSAGFNSAKSLLHSSLGSSKLSGCVSSILSSVDLVIPPQTQVKHEDSNSTCHKMYLSPSSNSSIQHLHHSSSIHSGTSSEGPSTTMNNPTAMCSPGKKKNNKQNVLVLVS